MIRRRVSTTIHTPDGFRRFICGLPETDVVASQWTPAPRWPPAVLLCVTVLTECVGNLQVRLPPLHAPVVWTTDERHTLQRLHHERADDLAWVHGADAPHGLTFAD